MAGAHVCESALRSGRSSRRGRDRESSFPGSRPRPFGPLRSTSKPGRRLAVWLAGLIAATHFSAAQVRLVEPADDRWIARDHEVVLRFDALPSTAEGRLAIFIGKNDVTDLCASAPSGELRCSPAMLPMAEGAQDVAVYVVKTAEEWREIARMPIKVLTRSGLEVSEYAPRVGVSQVADIDSGGSETTIAQGTTDSRTIARGTTTGRGSDQDLNTVMGQGGVATRWRRSGWEMRSAWNAVAASDETRALRYSTLGEEAPRLDLSEYLIELDHGGTHAALGNVSFGDQPLLMSGVSHRGLGSSTEPRRRASTSVSPRRAASSRRAIPTFSGCAATTTSSARRWASIF
jgi:hypothetical protein